MGLGAMGGLTAFDRILGKRGKGTEGPGSGQNEDQQMT
jgi:hypothetical protein